MIHMKIEWKTCAKIGISAFLLYLAIFYWPHVWFFVEKLISAVSPVAIGFAIAYVLNLLMSFYERHYFTKYAEKPIVAKSRIPMCLIAAIVSLFAIIALIIGLIVPELVLCIKFLVSKIPPFVEMILDNDLVAKYVPEDAIKNLESIDWNQLVSKAVQFVVSGIGSAAEAIFSAVYSTLSTFVTAFISVIFSVYFLLGKNTLMNHARRLLHNYFAKFEEKVLHVSTVFNDAFHKFIVGQCIEAVILGGLCTLGMAIFRFPYAQMIGAFIGFTALIPVAGAYIGAVVGALMIMTVSPVKALLFIVFIIVLQQLEGNLIYPKVVGNSIGLPAVWVLAAITIGGGLMGIFGMLIGVPIFAAVYRLIVEDVTKRETAEKREKELRAKKKPVQAGNEKNN